MQAGIPEAILNGKISPAVAREIARSNSTLIAALNVQIKYSLVRGEKHKIQFLNVNEGKSQ
jgi:hypothetical protein